MSHNTAPTPHLCLCRGAPVTWKLCAKGQTIQGSGEPSVSGTSLHTRGGGTLSTGVRRSALPSPPPARLLLGLFRPPSLQRQHVCPSVAGTATPTFGRLLFISSHLSFVGPQPSGQLFDLEAHCDGDGQQLVLVCKSSWPGLQCLASRNLATVSMAPVSRICHTQGGGAVYHSLKAQRCAVCSVLRQQLMFCCMLLRQGTQYSMRWLMSRSGLQHELFRPDHSMLHRGL